VRFKSWSAILGVKNLMDRKQYGFSTSGQFIPVLAPRTFLLTLRTSFD
jgi:iron complex outermembrane receptor protein